MNIQPLVAAVFAVSVALPVFAQTHDRKDLKKAENLAAADRGFKSLPEDEKQAVVLFIAEKIHGRRRKAIGANIRSFKGSSLEDLQKKVRRNVVVAEQDTEPVSIPGTSRIDVKHIDTPPFGRLFADNEWTVLDDSAEARALKQNIDRVIDVIKQGEGRLVSMHIESSASTLRNTGKAAKMTHLELSKHRAEAAARYALDYLKTKDIALDEDDQVTLDYEGTNGNGTSGASSPFPVAAGTDPKLVAGGSCEAPPELKAVAAKGAAMTPEDGALIATFYNPNKFVQLTFDAAFEVKDATPGSETPGEAHMVTATVQYKTRRPVKMPHITLPRINLRSLFGNSEKRRAKRAVRCPKFK